MNHNSAKTVFWWLLNATLVVLIIVGFTWAKVLRNQVDTFSGRTITVSADGKTVVVPDIAKFSFSVVSEGTDPRALKNENAEKINTALAFIKKQGLDDKDIKTVAYDLSPRYDYDRFTGRSTIFGYTLTQTIQLKIRDFEKIGTILAELPKEGINQISSLVFDLDDPDTAMAAARAEAFAKARVKAELMASENQVGLGKVITFSENSGGFPIPFLREASFGKADVAAPVVPQIQPGSQEVNVSVSVTYAIR